MSIIIKYLLVISFVLNLTRQSSFDAQSPSLCVCVCGHMTERWHTEGAHCEVMSGLMLFSTH